MSRTVVVTGGGTGIGRAVARRFAADGDRVIVTGRRAEPLDRTVELAGPTARAIRCDGTDPAELAALLADPALASPSSTVDVLVNNAGGNTDFDGNPDFDGDAQDAQGDLKGLATAYRANFDANVLTAVLTTAALSDRLADGGSVISIGSIAADHGAESYGAAKAALASWNVSLAGQLGPRGITANVVSPGYIADTEFFRDRMTDERRAALVAATATKRAGRPDDVAETVHFLASSGARHVSGQVLNVNGGAHTTR